MTSRTPVDDPAGGVVPVARSAGSRPLPPGEGRGEGRTEANVYTIPPGLPFVDALAAGLRSRLGEAPEDLASAQIFLPTRRACRALSLAFVRQAGGRPLLLPKMTPLGDIDEDDLAFEDESVRRRWRRDTAGDPGAAAAVVVGPAGRPPSRPAAFAGTGGAARGRTGASVRSGAHGAARPRRPRQAGAGRAGTTLADHPRLSAAARRVVAGDGRRRAMHRSRRPPQSPARGAGGGVAGVASVHAGGRRRFDRQHAGDGGSAGGHRVATARRRGAAGARYRSRRRDMAGDLRGAGRPRLSPRPVAPAVRTGPAAAPAANRSATRAAVAGPRRRGHRAGARRLGQPCAGARDMRGGGGRRRGPAAARRSRACPWSRRGRRRRRHGSSR